MFFFLFSLISCDISYLNISRGVHHYTHEFKKNDQLLINITQFPFYIIFSSFPENLTYYEYSSRSPERITNRDISFTSNNYQVYRTIELPYGSITLEATKSLTFTFTYAVLPGYCTTGVYMNTDIIDSITMSSKSAGFYQLNNYEDKCFIFTTEAESLQISVKQVSFDASDRVFFHTTYTDSYTRAGNFSESWIEPSVDEVPFVRVLTNRGEPPTNLNIDMSSNGAKPSNPQTVTHIPRGRQLDCEHEMHWYSEELVIMLAVCSGFLAIVLVLLIACRIANRSSMH